MPSQQQENTVCFDYSHHNTLTIESSANADFTQFLFASSFQLGKIQAGFTDIEKLKKYRLIVIGGPRESNYSNEEIKVLVEYVRKGGNLLVFHDEGGDYGTNSNLSDLTQFFGFKFKNNIMFDSVNFQRQQSRIIVNDFEPHPTTENVNSIVLSSACSIEIDELIAADQNISLIPLAKSSVNAYCTEWDGEDWIEEMDAWNSIMAIYSKVYTGRVIGLTTVSMLSSLSSAYGFFAMNNQEFIANIFKWLLEPADLDGEISRDHKLITLPVNYNLLLWMEQLVATPRWKNMGELINFAVLHLKNNYFDVIKLAEEKRDQLVSSRRTQIEALSKIQDPLEREKKARILEQEITMLNLNAYSEEIVEDLQEIMQSLSNMTEGKVGGIFTTKELTEKLRIEQEKIKMAQEKIQADSEEIISSSDPNCLPLNDIKNMPHDQLRDSLSKQQLAISCEDSPPKKDSKQNSVIAEMHNDKLTITIENDNLDDMLKKLRDPSLISEKIDKFKKAIK